MMQSLVYSLKLKKNALKIICIIALLYRFFPNGLSTHYYMETISLFNSSGEVREKLGGIDAGQLLDASITFSQFQQLDQETQFWIARVWSLGISAFQVPAIWLEQLNVPFTFTMVSLSCGLWLTLIFLIFRLIQNNNSRIIFAVLFISFLYSFDGNFLFSEFPFNPESIALALNLISLTILINELVGQKFRFKNLVLSGFVLGMSIWVRYTIDFAVIGIWIVSCISLVSSYVKNLHSKPEIMALTPIGRKKLQDRNFLKTIVIAFSIALIFTLPIRLSNQFIYGGKPMMMSSSQELMGANLWAKIDSPHALYWDKTGMNWACKLEPVKCSSLDLSNTKSSTLVEFAVIAAVTNPYEYLQNRLSHFYSNHTGILSNNGLFFIYSLFQLALIIAIPILLFFKKISKKKLLVTIWAPFILLQYLTFLIVHYETRYFVPLHVFNLSLLFSILHFGLNFRLPRNENQANIKA
jgi:hypothetical protein